MKKVRKCVLRKLDISGNMNDISIINALRSVLETKSSLRSLSISNLHKINPKSQGIIINAFAKNTNLKHIDLKRTTEAFYYSLREKLQEREEGPIVKISFIKFVQERNSEKKDENVNEDNITPDKTNDYNSNFTKQINRRVSIKAQTDYSTQVRKINKEKFTAKKSAKKMKESVVIQVPKSDMLKHQSTDEEESEISEMTDNMVTTYQRCRNMHSIDSGNEDQNNKNSLQYSMSNLESESSDSSS
jgi:hypothetical protein